MGTLGIIPARGGSKGIPRKNLLTMAGKPLMAWTVDAARASGNIDRLIVSTEDAEIAAAARQLDCEVPFVRPAHLAQDETLAIDVALHALDALADPFDFVVWLQPTSPGRLPEDIAACVRACRAGAAPGCVSLVRATEPPQWMFTLSSGGVMQPLIPREQIPLRRQDLPPAFLINGAVYVGRPDWLREHRTFLGPGVLGYEMPADRSIDIDSWDEWHAAEARLAGCP